MAMGGIARVAQMQLLQPFVTFALASVFNDETITPQILLFAAGVVVTVAISTRTRGHKTPDRPELTPVRSVTPPATPT
jgi:drug/metabolite transporter (DMT)-like permease